MIFQLWSVILTEISLFIVMSNINFNKKGIDLICLFQLDALIKPFTILNIVQAMIQDALRECIAIKELRAIEDRQA